MLSKRYLDRVRQMLDEILAHTLYKLGFRSPEDLRTKWHHGAYSFSATS